MKLKVEDIKAEKQLQKHLKKLIVQMEEIVMLKVQKHIELGIRLVVAKLKILFIELWQKKLSMK